MWLMNTDKPLTVGRLMEQLSKYDKDLKVKIKHDDLGSAAVIHSVILREADNYGNEACVVVIWNTDDVY